MSATRIAEQSNTFSTGGGGVHFENQVQAVFAISLFLDGFAPVVSLPNRELHFQAKRMGYDTDDLVVESWMYPSQKAKLLCQMKHDIVVSDAKSNTVFQEVINAAWSDYTKSIFNKDIDKIALLYVLHSLLHLISNNSSFIKFSHLYYNVYSVRFIVHI